MDVEGCVGGGRGRGGCGPGGGNGPRGQCRLTAPPAICTAQAVRPEGGQRPYIRETMHSALNL